MSSTSLPRMSAATAAEPFRRTLAGKLALCFAASMFVAVCAHISVPMPFTPVPTTMQTFAVVLVGMALGPIQGFAALALYLAEGAAGAPVFSPHGPGGVLQLLGPTAGYLFAYPIAAALAGAGVHVLRRFLASFPAALAASAVALLPVFGMGATWLGHVMGLTGAQAVHLAVTPFLGAEVFKIFAAAAAYSGIKLARPSESR